MQQIKVSLYKFVNYGFRHSFTYPFVSNLQVMNSETEWLRYINVPRTIAERFHVSNEAFIMWRNHVGTYYAIVVPDGTRGKYQQVTMFVGQNIIASGAEVVDVLRKLKHTLVDLNNTAPQLVEKTIANVILKPDTNPVSSPVISREVAFCNYETEDGLNGLLSKAEDESIALYNNVWIVGGSVETVSGITSLNGILNQEPEAVCNQEAEANLETDQEPKSVTEQAPVVDSAPMAVQETESENESVAEQEPMPEPETVSEPQPEQEQELEQIIEPTATSEPESVPVQTLSQQNTIESGGKSNIIKFAVLAIAAICVGAIVGLMISNKKLEDALNKAYMDSIANANTSTTPDIPGFTNTRGVLHIQTKSEPDGGTPPPVEEAKSEPSNGESGHHRHREREPHAHGSAYPEGYYVLSGSFSKGDFVSPVRISFCSDGADLYGCEYTNVRADDGSCDMSISETSGGGLSLSGYDNEGTYFTISVKKRGNSYRGTCKIRDLRWNVNLSL